MIDGRASRGRVLVVDDEPAVCELLQFTLEDEGYEVRTAEHGRAALETLGAWRADLILLDLSMPVMDGRTFREEQLRRPELAAIPVVITTAIANLRAGTGDFQAAAILPKPFALESLLKLINPLVDRRAPPT